MSMNRKPVTQEEKKLVGHLKKKKRASGGTHVYYNRSKNGTSSYLQGKYYSEKNKKKFTYRSSYELKFFSMLEEDPEILSYEAEAVQIPYTDFDGTKRTYVPDILATKTDGSMIVYEIKPRIMLTNLTVRIKAKACREFFYNLLKGEDLSVSYKFITEEDLFESSKEYTEFIKLNKK